MDPKFQTLVTTQKSVTVTSRILENLNASSASTRPSLSPETLRANQASLKFLHDAIIALATHLRKEITSASLAFSGGKEKISIDAAVGTLPKIREGFEKTVAVVIGLSQGIGGTSSNVSAKQGGSLRGVVGECLFAEWRTAVLDLASGLTKLLESFSSEIGSDSKAKPANTRPAVTVSTGLPTNGSTAPYLLATSALWSIIDSKLLQASPSESRALQKVLKSHCDRLNDAIEGEYKDLLEEDEGVEMGDGSAHEFDDPTGDEDEWASLERDISGGDRLSPEEREQVKKVQTPLRLALFLHRRVAQQFVAIDPQPQSSAILASSQKIMSATDDLIANLYAPQELEEINEAVDDLMSSSASLCDDCLQRLNSLDKTYADTEGLSEDLTKLGISGQAPTPTTTTTVTEKAGERTNPQKSKMTTEIKWLSLWSLQMEKAKKTWRSGAQ